MKASSKFGTGGCYTCGDCCRKTRQTGRGDHENCGLCAECYDRGTIENQMSDEGETPDRQHAKGGAVMSIRMYRWSRDTLGTTRRAEPGSLAVVRSGRSWSVARCVQTRHGLDLENVSDHRTMREARTACANQMGGTRV